ncbi:Putative amidase AmiD [Polaromonas vacuolata]|uniref:Amidase AmiD n=1 Tax=Polaromonas vacuolata TaxID=37448 RepID=A0A6H2HEG7_9BURK|nr:amidase [Polaromonas vacuolata]QJC57974.1 Putative amidase AmiD [Polaromonas vacuolata]
MSPLISLSAREIAKRVANRELTAQAVASAYIEQIQSLDADIQAWQFFDPDLALKNAKALDQKGVDGLLSSIPVGIKDLMDTADMPTSYGSPIYAGHRPQTDAACVATCRAHGALIMGKTVSTEFATFKPGMTRNPRAPKHQEHSPGGSSSGSAAAVAANMVPLAFGTQTAGSIIRPAAYCGVVGYKPTHGTLALAGIKALSPSLDTVGVLARSVDDAAFFIGALIHQTMTPIKTGQLRIGVCRTPHWGLATADSQRALAQAMKALEKSGAQLHDLTLPPSCEDLTAIQIQIMAYEASAAFAPERKSHAELFSPAFSALMTAGQAISGIDFAKAQSQAGKARADVDALFASCDAILAPSAGAEAPAGLDATGDPIFNRLWTLLGLPCVHVPVGLGGCGMPVGVTLIGPRWADLQALSAAHTLELALR